MGVLSPVLEDTSEITIVSCSASDQEEWDAFVAACPLATNYHRWGWRQVIEGAFGWPCFYIAARAEGRTCGVLPIVWQKSRLFGSFMTSMPFLNGGGVLAETESAALALTREAIALASRNGAKYLELRHREAQPGLELATRSHKVRVVREVQPDTEAMFRSFDPKLRADIRKALKWELQSEVGGPELLQEFYRIFTENMRDLGTPPYSRSFFDEIYRVFPDTTYITVVRHQGTAIASSFLIAHGDTVEAGWSSSLRKYLAMKPNMALYWQNLRLAGERGYRLFDFGRSTVGSGTHRFKMQWGGREEPLHWDYWAPPGGTLPDLNPNNPKYELMIRAWKKLPVGLTRLIGPPIVKRLP
ncbi:MAG: FemAB family XrtA/PEP-CTERM system-associated protein [Candidatus Korobacteraceae bacterium]